MAKINSYSQYKNDFFNKLQFNFQEKKNILDVGCGTATDAPIFIKEYGLKFYGSDIYKDENVKKQKLRFKKGSIYRIPYEDSLFDYVFVHDVLHHVDEQKQRRDWHVKGLKELARVCKDGGFIIVTEGNRYNPLFYPHMVKIRRHEHFTQPYFISVIKEAFSGQKITFTFFEAHVYPKLLLPIFKIYEYCMEHFFPKQFLAYNVAIIKKNENKRKKN